MTHILAAGLPFQTLSACERGLIWTLRSHVRGGTDGQSGCNAATLFIDTFRAGLAEPIVIAPLHCRCPLRLHEETLVRLMRTTGNIRAFDRVVEDLLPTEIIERLWQLAGPLEAELEAWLTVSGVMR